MHILKVALLRLMILIKLLVPLHSAMPALMQIQEWAQITLFSFVNSMKDHLSEQGPLWRAGSPWHAKRLNFLSGFLGILSIFPGYILIYISKAVIWSVCRLGSFSNYVFHLIDVKVSVVWVFSEPLCFKNFIAYSINLLNCFGFYVSVIFKICSFNILAMRKKAIKDSIKCK